MQLTLVLVLAIAGVLQVFTQPINTTLQYPLCQQCRSLCSVEQGISGGPPMIGEAGQLGTVNMTAMKELIKRTVEEVLLGSPKTTISATTETNLPETTKSTQKPLTARSCRGISLESAKSRHETGGVFDIIVPEIGVKEVYCDVTTAGGNWIVFQRRMDGSVDFNRLWTDYVTGFGDVNGEFWLGLEAIHQLTRIGRHQLRFDMIAKDGTHYFAQYRYFKVGPASSNYRLSVSGYHYGNATDAFGKPSKSYYRLNGIQFSTKNRDNDRWSGGHCARGLTGGWWFNLCSQSLLNGKYNNMYWQKQYRNEELFMRFTEMKFR